MYRLQGTEQSGLSPIKIFVTNFLEDIQKAPRWHCRVQLTSVFMSFSDAPKPTWYNDVVEEYLTRHLEGFLCSRILFEIMQMWYIFWLDCSNTGLNLVDYFVVVSIFFLGFI